MGLDVSIGRFMRCNTILGDRDKRFAYWVGARPCKALAIALFILCYVPIAAADGSTSGEQAAAAPRPTKILAFGDSLTAGYGLAAEHSFPAQLQAALAERGHDVEVINSGVSGETTAGGLARLGWALGDDPDAVIVELGANDALRGIEPADTRRNLDAILEQLTERGIVILLAGMRAPPNMGDDYAAEFDAIFPELAQAHGTAYYPFFLDGVAARPELNLSDGLHPNADGVAVIVDGILPHVLRLLDALAVR